MFLISALVPNSIAPRKRTETLASQRSEPSSILTSDTPSSRTCAERLEIGDGFIASSGFGLGDALHQRHSGPVEIDQRIGEFRRSDRRRNPHASICRYLPRDGSASAGTLRGYRPPASTHRAALRERHVVLRDLVILGHVRIEVVLPIELRKRRDFGVERQPARRSSARSPACSAPAAHRATPKQTGQNFVFGSPPNSLGQPQNILLAVFSSTWHSMPITASQLMALRPRLRATPRRGAAYARSRCAHAKNPSRARYNTVSMRACCVACS